MIDDMSLDGAIIDVSLRGEESDAVAEALRARSIPFAFATGYDRSDVANRFPGDVILTKPFRFDEVEAAIGKFRGALPRLNRRRFTQVCIPCRARLFLLAPRLLGGSSVRKQ